MAFLSFHTMPDLPTVTFDPTHNRIVLPIGGGLVTCNLVLDKGDINFLLQLQSAVEAALQFNQSTAE